MAIRPSGDGGDGQAQSGVVLHHRDPEPARPPGRGGSEHRRADGASPPSSASSTRARSRSAAPEIEQLCEAVGVALDYVHPAPRGLTIQRNIGIERTTGDPVFLIDDDVWLAPDVHEEILAEYERWGPELGGVRGAPVHPPSPSRLTILWRRLFGMGGWWPEGSGRMRAGFFVEGVASSNRCGGSSTSTAGSCPTAARSSSTSASTSGCPATRSRRTSTSPTGS